MLIDKLVDLFLMLSFRQRRFGKGKQAGMDDRDDMVEHDRLVPYVDTSVVVIFGYEVGDKLADYGHLVGGHDDVHEDDDEFLAGAGLLAHLLQTCLEQPYHFGYDQLRVSCDRFGVPRQSLGHVGKNVEREHADNFVWLAAYGKQVQEDLADLEVCQEDLGVVFRQRHEAV